MRFPPLPLSLSLVAYLSLSPTAGLAQTQGTIYTAPLPAEKPQDLENGVSKVPDRAPTAAPAPAPKKSKKEREKEEAERAIAEARADLVPPRKGAWSIGFDARQLNITPDDRRYKQRSVAPDVNVGYVYINESWFAMIRGHLAFGPTSQHYPDSPPIDYEGFGFSGTYGKSIRKGLRKDAGDYGAEVTVEAFELVGRSFRRQILSDGAVSNAWVMKNSWTAVTPALFATFLKPSRPQGNRPEWLQTRIEGYRIGLGVVIPVQSSWDLRWEKDAVGLEDRGKWRGVFGMASLTAWLGI